MNDATMTLWTGILFTLASLFVGIREICLRPENTRFPKAPFALRVSLFVYLVVLFCLGTSAIFSVTNHQPLNWGGAMLMLAGATAGHNLLMAVNMLRQHYPARFWDRINKLFALAECGRDGRVAFLGVTLLPARTKR